MRPGCALEGSRGSRDCRGAVRVAAGAVCARLRVFELLLWSGACWRLDASSAEMVGAASRCE